MEASRELDALLAEKVMGLRPCVFREISSVSGLVTMWACEHVGSSKCFPTNKEAVEHRHSPLAHYSTELLAAWQLVEKVLPGLMLMQSDSGRWAVASGATGPMQDGMTDPLIWTMFFEQGDWQATPALAICRAALEYVDTRSASGR